MERDQRPPGVPPTEAEKPPPIPKKVRQADVDALERETRKLERWLKEPRDLRFLDLGGVLKRVRDRRLHEAKRYRDLDDYAAALGLGPGEGARLVRAVETFRPEAVRGLPWARVEAALEALDEPGDPGG